MTRASTKSKRLIRLNFKKFERSFWMKFLKFTAVYFSPEFGAIMEKIWTRTNLGFFPRDDCYLKFQASPD